MRIALISFEYAGGRAGGGIGTYVRNAAEMLRAGGHIAHVFTGGDADGREAAGDGLVVTTIACAREHFGQAVVEAFAQAHAADPFDVVEGPEFGTDAADVARRFPALPLVVRLHGPTFSIGHSNAHYIGLKSRLRFALGALRRGRLPTDPWTYNCLADPERRHALEADEVVANSRATSDYCRKAWELGTERLSVVHYPFIPAEPLSRLEPNPASRTVLFLGKLEARKGVLELARAIPLVLCRHSETVFRMVGPVLPHPGDRRPLSEHVLAIAGRGADNIEIVGGVPYESIAEEYARASICVFPSDWEASGFVCFEGMAAGRAVVGSQAGGMAEIIEHGRNGMIVPHRNPAAIAATLNELLDSPALCERLGRAGRATVVERFAPTAILPQQIASYERAIANARRRDPAFRYGFA